MYFDVAIIGGGAAGMFCAIHVKRSRPHLSVAILEGLDRVGKKLITTGNGRCNITNKYATLKNYHGADADFIDSVFSRHFVADSVKFFETLGVDIVFEPDGKGYPASFQASGVVDALRLTCDELGVVTLCNTRVNDIKKGFVINGNIKASAVIMTGGLMSGGAKVGCDGSALALSRALGHKTVPLCPSIVQLKTDTTLTRQLKGIKVDADISLLRGVRVLRREFGELLFTDYGLSGPPILQLSRGAVRGCKIVADLLPDISEGALCKKLEARRELLKNRTIDNFLTGLINKRLGQVVLKCCGYKLTDPVSSMSDMSAVAGLLKSLSFDVEGNTGFSASQVTAGGVAHTELTEDLESKKIKRLFFAGEIIDVDGDCGGYNLQWAWSSGFVAAEGVLKCF